MKRFLHSKALPRKSVVDLAFNHVKPSYEVSNIHLQSRPAIVNIHGIFGSRNMFRSISKQLADKLDMDVYSVDLRNHGESPWAVPYDFITLSKDVIQFIKRRIGAERPVNLLGFSIGGKIALLTTLCEQVNIKKCISIDLPPYETPKLDPVVIENYGLIMKIINREIKIEKGSPNWKQVLLGYFKALPANMVNNGDPSLYFANGFFCVKKNGEPLDPHKPHKGNDDQFIDYYLPLEQFPDILDSVKRWPDLHGQENKDGSLQTSTDRSVLFMRALQSEFIKDDYSLLKKSFPNAQVREFNTGHNMTVEQPKETFKCIVDYFKT